MEISQINIGQQFFRGYAGPSQVFAGNDLTGIAQLVSLFIKISFVLAGLILLFFFILGGIGMMGSAGKGDPAKAEEAKKTITSAVIGFIVVFAAYWIVKLIGQLLNIPNLI